MALTIRMASASLKGSIQGHKELNQLIAAETHAKKAWQSWIKAQQHVCKMTENWVKTMPEQDQARNASMIAIQLQVLESQAQFAESIKLRRQGYEDVLEKELEVDSLERSLAKQHKQERALIRKTEKAYRRGDSTEGLDAKLRMVRQDIEGLSDTLARQRTQLQQHVRVSFLEQNLAFLDSTIAQCERQNRAAVCMQETLRYGYSEQLQSLVQELQAMAENGTQARRRDSLRPEIVRVDTLLQPYAERSRSPPPSYTESLEHASIACDVAETAIPWHLTGGQGEETTQHLVSSRTALGCDMQGGALPPTSTQPADSVSVAGSVAGSHAAASSVNSSLVLSSADEPTLPAYRLASPQVHHAYPVDPCGASHARNGGTALSDSGSECVGHSSSHGSSATEMEPGMVPQLVPAQTPMYSSTATTAIEADFACAFEHAQPTDETDTGAALDDLSSTAEDAVEHFSGAFAPVRPSRPQSRAVAAMPTDGASRSQSFSAW
eukprot:m.52354 g.52354  ORF g.52354 m.52354 type:complete len:494 (+) comp11299_c0_seq1:678-2159(+)